MVGTIIVGFAKYATYCGLIFADTYHEIHKNLYIHLVNFCAYGNIWILQENTAFVDSPTSSTTAIINDSCSLAFCWVWRVIDKFCTHEELCM